MRARMAPEQPHDVADRQQVGLLARRAQQHRVHRPAGAGKIGQGRDVDDIRVPLEQGHAAGVVEPRDPLAQHLGFVVRLDRQVALGDGELGRRAEVPQRRAGAEQLVLDLAVHAVERLPGGAVILAIVAAVQHRRLVAGVLVHHVDGDHVDQLAALLDQFVGPPLAGIALHVAPADQLDRGVACLHGLGEFDIVQGVLGAGEALARLGIRGLVADLPGVNGPWRLAAIADALGIVGVVAVADEVGGFGGVARALLAQGGVDIFGAPVGGEVDRHDRLGRDGLAELQKFVDADDVLFPAAPQVVDHVLAGSPRADAFAPLPEAGEDAAPADRARRQVAHHVDEVRPPAVAERIPAGFDRRVGGAERLHELHVETRRNGVQRPRVDLDRRHERAPETYLMPEVGRIPLTIQRWPTRNSRIIGKEVTKAAARITV